MPKFTNEQLLAINHENENILVSAGAGSGKTAVLTERVLRKVKEGTKINNLLILTFTNKAAMEMKERIRKKLKKEELYEDLDLLDSSYITTFDAFSMALVKKYKDELGISGNVKVIEETLLKIKEEELLDNLMDEYYQSDNLFFQELINNFCLKDDKELKEKILHLNKTLDLVLDKDLFLASYIDNYYNDSNINIFIDSYLELVEAKTLFVKELLKDFMSLLEEEYLEKVRLATNKFMNAESYQDVKNNLVIKLPNLPKGSEEEVKDLKKEITKLIKELEDYYSYSSTTSMKDSILKTKDNNKMILEIIRKLDKRLTSYKKEKEAFTFLDIEKLAIKLVKENIDVREELKDNFKEILIDEYQDTNDIQEEFISYIANNNLYMVGDIKQSIYRFRNANPKLFLTKYNNYKRKNGGLVIDLMKNFRSREEVLNNINNLFAHIMDEELGGASYLEGHEMVFGNSTYLKEVDSNIDYNLSILEYDITNKDYSSLEKEAFIIANDIKEKLNKGINVFDKDLNKLRKASLKDFVILLDRATDFKIYKQIFEYLEIPLTLYQSESGLARYDLELLKNVYLLGYKLFKKEYDSSFRYSYTSVARSFLYNYTDEEIYNYLNNDIKSSKVYEDFQELVSNYYYSSPVDYLLNFLSITSYNSKLIKIGQVKTYLARMEYFYNLIKSLEEMSSDIIEVTNYLERLCQDEIELKLALSKSESDSVKIMTIHMSKGLEYPICYFAGFSKKFNMSDLKGNVLYDSDYGIVIPDFFNNNDLITKKLLLDKIKKEDISEKIRLLYVALTRAREKMVIVIPETEKNTSYDLVPNNIRLNYNSFLSMVKSILGNFKDNIIKIEDIKGLTNKYRYVKEVDSKDEVKENLEFIPSIYQKEEEIVSSFSKKSIKKRSFDEISLMEFGSLVHEILEYTDLKEKIIPKTTSKLIEKKINSFLNSSFFKLYQDLDMYKEYEFISEEDSKTSHGIIDLLLVGDSFAIIVDYKLQNTVDLAYKKQLKGYKEIIEKKLSKPVMTYLYSIMDEEFKAVDV